MGVTTAEEGQGETRWNQRTLLVVTGVSSLIGWLWGLSTGSGGVVFALLLITGGLAALYVGNRRARAELEELRGELEVTRREAKETGTRLKTANTDLEDTRTNLQRTRAKVGEMLIYIDELKEKISGSKGSEVIEQLEAELEEAEARLTETEDALEECLRTEQSSTDPRVIEQLEAELEKTKAELEDTRVELGSTNDELKNKTEDLKESQKRLEDCLERNEQLPDTGLVIGNVGSDDGGNEVLVKLTNEGNETISLGGCSMVDGDGRRFRGFPNGFELDADDSETFEIEKGFGIESTEPVTLYHDDEPIGHIRWEMSA